MGSDGSTQSDRLLTVGESDIIPTCRKKALMLCNSHRRSSPLEKGAHHARDSAFPSLHSLEASEAPVPAHTKPREPCPKASGTAEIAFFLKHTGPPTRKPPLEVPVTRSPPGNKRRSSLRIFKKGRFAKRNVRSATHSASSSSGETALPYNIVRRTLSNGKSYLSITPTAETACRLRTQSSHRSLRSTARAFHTSDALIARTVIPDTDAFDDWPTSAELGRDGGQSPSLPAITRSQEVARASSRLLGCDERPGVLIQCPRPETSWGRKLLCSPEEVQQQAVDTSDLRTRDGASSSNPRGKAKDRTSFGRVVDAALGPLNSDRPSSTLVGLDFDGDDFLGSSSSIHAGVLRPAGASVRKIATSGRKESLDLLRHDRDISTRARKLRDLQGARQNANPFVAAQDVDAAVETIPAQGGESKDEPKSRRGDMFAAYLSSPHSPGTEVPLASSPDMLTGGTTRSSESSLSPVMLIAEHFPLPRTKHFKRPTRLLLPAKQASEQLAIAVREGVVESIKKSIEIPGTNTTLADRLRPFTCQVAPDAGAEAPLRSNAPSISREASPSQSRLPKRSIATSEHASGPNVEQPTVNYGATTGCTKPSPNLPARSPYRLMAQSIPAQLRRSDVRSSAGSTETRLEARIESLERENRLLEAALMAVLKTGGRLNGCPCGGDEPVSRVAGEPAKKTSMGNANGEAVVSRNGKYERDDWERPKKSPLSVYLETRAHSGSVSSVPEASLTE